MAPCLEQPVRAESGRYSVFYAPRLRAAEVADDGDEMLSARPPVPARIGQDQPSRRMGPRVEQLDLDGSTAQVALDGIAAPRGELFELGVPVGALCAYSQADAVCAFDDQSHQHRVGRLDSDAADEGFVDRPSPAAGAVTRRARSSRHRNRPPPTAPRHHARRSAQRRVRRCRCSCSGRRLPWTIDPAADRSRGECPQRG